jgi:hypothetical protein
MVDVALLRLNCPPCYLYQALLLALPLTRHHPGFRLFHEPGHGPLASRQDDRDLEGWTERERQWQSQFQSLSLCRVQL